MRLLDCAPEFLHRTDDTHYRRVKTLAEADGIIFVCPQCLFNSGKRPGCHSVICWSPRVPQTTAPTPGRWDMHGTGLEDLTLVAGSSSVSLAGPGCQAHFLVQGGRMINCGSPSWDSWTSQS